MLSVGAAELVRKAQKQGLWLYDPSYRKWYSPEDFQHIFSYANASPEFLNQVQLRDPVEGVHAGFKRLADLQEKLNNFTRAVINYYTPKDGKF